MGTQRDTLGCYFQAHKKQENIRSWEDISCEVGSQHASRDLNPQLKSIYIDTGTAGIVAVELRDTVLAHRQQQEGHNTGHSKE